MEVEKLFSLFHQDWCVNRQITKGNETLWKRNTCSQSLLSAGLKNAWINSFVLSFDNKLLIIIVFENVAM